MSSLDKLIDNDILKIGHESVLIVITLQFIPRLTGRSSLVKRPIYLIMRPPSIYVGAKEAIVTVSDQNQLIADWARVIVTQTAPEEIPLFRVKSVEYFKNPDKLLKGQESKDDMLGFGAGEAVILVTPYVLTIATQVIKFVTEELSKALATQSADAIGDIVKRIFQRPGKKQDDTISIPLTHEQLAQIYHVAYQTALGLHLPDEKAKLLAHATVGSLAVAPS